MDSVTGLLKTTAKAFGRGLLNAGVPQVDATPEAREYKLYKAEQEALGLPAVSQEEYRLGKR